MQETDAAAAQAAVVFDLDSAHFEQPVCRNCGEALSTAFCGACGQAKARRLGSGDLRAEAWTSWRLFEISVVTAAWRLVIAPGRVAREYVLGARKKQMHPLKLLLVAVGLLLLMLGQTGYLASGHAQVSRAMALVQSWGKWSFSLGLLAILAASGVVFGRRMRYNLVEHLVLAAYVQALVIAVNLVNLLPLLWWQAPELIQLHKAASKLHMEVVEAAVVAVAFRQFFLVDPRREWPRLVQAALVFVAVKWLLLRLYGWLVVRIVLAQLA